MLAWYRLLFFLIHSLLFLLHFHFIYFISPLFSVLCCRHSVYFLLNFSPLLVLFISLLTSSPLPHFLTFLSTLSNNVKHCPSCFLHFFDTKKVIFPSDSLPFKAWLHARSGCVCNFSLMSYVLAYLSVSSYLYIYLFSIIWLHARSGCVCNFSLMSYVLAYLSVSSYLYIYLFSII